MPADIVASAAVLQVISAFLTTGFARVRIMELTFFAVQVGYGASIASFLGGIHWALAMANYGAKTIDLCTSKPSADPGRSLMPGCRA